MYICYTLLCIWYTLGGPLSILIYINIWKDHASVYNLAPVTDCALFSSPAALYTKSIPLGINRRACDREKDPGAWENTGNDGGIQQDGNAGMF